MLGTLSKSPRAFAVVVSLAYLAASLAWIGLSDRVGTALFASAEALQRFQTYKGTAFVVLTALLIYLLLDARRAEPPADGAAREGAPLGLLLAGLVLATAVPLMALLIYNAMRDTRVALREAHALVGNVAAATAADMAALLKRQERTLAVLKRTQLPQRGDAESCRRLLGFIGSINEHVRGAAVLDVDGRVMCTSGDPELATSVPPALLAERAAPILAGPTRRSHAGGWTFSITYPLDAEPDAPMRAVQLSMSSAALEQLLRAPLPAGGVTALVDAQGTILARSPDAGLVGSRSREGGVFERMRRGDAVLLTGRDGIERVYALRPVHQMGLHLVAGVASDTVYREARDGALRAALVGLAVLLVAGMVVVRISRKLTAPMAALARTAERVAAGEPGHRAPENGPREVARVAVQFNRMLDRLPALERELRDSEARHRTLLEKLSRNIPGMIFQFRVAPDGTATVPFASHGIHAMFEVAPEEALRDAAVLQSRIHPDDTQRVAAATAESLRTLGHFSAEYRVLLPGAGLRHYLTHSQPERQDDGAVLWHGCTVDVTELERAREALERLNAGLEARVRERTTELAAANAALESFSSSVAHDLRAPLDAIGGFAGALPAALARGDAARASHLCERIAANARTMGEMTQGLLALARAGRGQPAETAQDLHAMARAVLADLLPPDAAVEVRLAPLPVARVDAPTLRQVFWNLLANAAKFTARVPAPRIEIGWDPRDGEAVFFVRDNGVGFDPAYADRLFSPFQRLHARSDYEGIGIGLTLVKRIVEWHGGRVWADAVPGAGATFFFTLPLARVVGEAP